MASFNKNLAVAVAFTLALLLASNGEETSSFGGSALCDTSTGVTCTTDANCVPTCKQWAGQNYVYGYCIPAAGGRGRSCACTVRCGAQSTQPPALEKPAWRATGMLN